MGDRGRSRKRAGGRAAVSRPTPDREEVVAIESLAAGGDSVAHLADGRVVFVRGGAPGDRARIRYADEGRRFVKSGLVEVVEIVEPGATRVEPACGVFGRCGGCAWQHVAYEAQLEAKRQILHEQLRRIGGISEPPKIKMFPSPAPLGYRSRTRLLIESGKVGYRRVLSNEIEPIDHCPVLDSALDRALAKLGQDLESGQLPAHELEGVEWELSLGDGGEVRSCSLDDSRSLRDGPARVTMRAGAEMISISPGVFSQGNALLRPELHREVVRACVRTEERHGTGHLLELFAGAGFFGLTLARHFDQLICVESDAAAIVDLRANLAAAGLENVDIRQGRVEQVLERPLRWSPDVVLLDPPRAGLVGDALSRVAALEARRIVYLSCDPATLSRDLAGFLRSGYHVHEVAAFDLFPQTPHIEAMVSLDREE